MTSLAAFPSSMQLRREAMINRNEFRLIAADEFCEMMVSKRQLIRVDHPELMLRGLFDPEQGLQFVVEEENLREHRAMS